jgi:tripartite-type tricarboxylate transporter receptor subunit TctC
MLQSFFRKPQPTFAPAGLKLTGVALAAMMAFAGAVADKAQAQDTKWPTHSMTMIIPFAAGGPTDVLGRIVGQHLSEVLKQQVVIQNLGGAGGTIGSERVRTSAPDGYTFVLGTVGTHAQSATMYKKPPYNPATDFKPVILIADVPIALMVRKDLPVSNLKEFATYVKAHEKEMKFGSAGAGSATHLGCVVVNTALGLNTTHIPYRGTGPAMQDLQAGNIDYLCEIISTAKPQIDAGRVKGIAMLTKERSQALPNLPTAIEQGTDIQAYTWNAFFMPKDTPDAIVKKLHDATNQVMNMPAVADGLKKLGANVVTEDRRSSAYLGQFVKDEIKKWAEPIKKSGVQVD